MDISQYENANYEIEKQTPYKKNGEWFRQVYIRQVGGNRHPIDQGSIQITEEEALALLPAPTKAETIKLEGAKFMLQILAQDANLKNILDLYLKESPAANALFSQELQVNFIELSAIKTVLEVDKANPDSVLGNPLADILIAQVESFIDQVQTTNNG